MSFTFWGLFVACGVVLAAYVVWMLGVERHEEGEGDGIDELGGADGPGTGTDP